MAIRFIHPKKPKQPETRQYMYQTFENRIVFFLFNPKRYTTYQLSEEDQIRLKRIKDRQTKWIRARNNAEPNTPEYKKAVRNIKYAKKQIRDMAFRYANYQP